MGVRACWRASGCGGGGGVVDREEWKDGKEGREENMGVKNTKKHLKESFLGVRKFSYRCQIYNFLRLYKVLQLLPSSKTLSPVLSGQLCPIL